MEIVKTANGAQISLGDKIISVEVARVKETKPMFKSVVSKTQYKTVTYFGQEFVIPSEYKFMAVDKYGFIFAYENKPELLIEHAKFKFIFGEVYLVGKAEFENPDDWVKTLKEG